MTRLSKTAETTVHWTLCLLVAGLLWYIRGALWLMDAVCSFLATITGEPDDD